ncbi:MAG: fructosamine kinase family protein [Ignavibacteriales bacterium]|nr:MAG: fructosamine kinase family protein [Ignavibacteriales bacterium]
MKSESKIFGEIEEQTGIKFQNAVSIGGGCISNAYKIETGDGSLLFLKLNDDVPESFFTKEANGLSELKKSGTIKVPEVINSGRNFIITEFVTEGNKKKNFFAEFGMRFAGLHKYTSDSFGFYEDNFIGSNVQINIADENQKSDWTNFYFDKRLLFQFKLAEKYGYVDSELRSAFNQLEKRISKIIGDVNEPPSLLHGDLWSGNFISTDQGEPCLIDPAVYYGNREADLAMTKLFGGFSGEFYKSYNETFPLIEDSDYRENVYKLYHVLNHLNLFGGSYYYQALSLMKYYLNN